MGLVLVVKLLNNRQADCIRLSGIDCPEKGQAFGKHAASELVSGKEVTVQTQGRDKYKRAIGDVLLPDGTNLNQELVKQQWCWWYQKYAPGGYGARRVRDRSTSCAERVVG